MVKIQIISDMHLEFRKTNFRQIIKPSAPILCLLGDICACGNDVDFEIYKKFITYIASKFKYVFHIPGNHEYYNTEPPNKTISEINSDINTFTNLFNNVFFLNNDVKRIVIKNKVYVFVGSPLWSYIQPKNKKEIQDSMNDYSCIYTDKKNIFKVDDMLQIHAESVLYIQKIMTCIEPNEIGVLLTHHKPIRDTDLNNVMSQAYETDLADKLITYPFRLACHGHTHKKYDKIINGVRVVSNPKGYPSEKTYYQCDFAVSI
jgi:predicted phosphodiesterase